MRRLVTLFIVVGLVLASAAPAGAKPIQKEKFEAVECITSFGIPEREWFSGHDDAVMHLRNMTNTANEYIFEEGVWVLQGTNSISANYNGAWVPHPFVPNVGIPIDGSFWGTFDLDLGTVGEFSGRWSWGKGTLNGRGAGSGAGQLVKVSLLGEDPGWATPYPCSEPGFVEYEVFTK